MQVILLTDAMSVFTKIMKDKLSKVRMAGTLIKIIFSDKKNCSSRSNIKINLIGIGCMRNVYACFIK